MTKITAIVVALILVLIPVASIAEPVYFRTAVVVGYGIAYSDCFEVEAVDEDGESWCYFQDIEDSVSVGDVVVLSIWDNGSIENDEIIDVELIDNIDIDEVLDWLEN